MLSPYPTTESSSRTCLKKWNLLLQDVSVLTPNQLVCEKANLKHKLDKEVCSEIQKMIAGEVKLAD
jgi:hypothetical protein